MVFLQANLSNARKKISYRAAGRCFKEGSFYSGTPLRPKAAGVEPHTHTNGRAGNFFWSWQAEWLEGACAVRMSHFMTFLYEAIFAQLLANGVRGIA